MRLWSLAFGGVCWMTLMGCSGSSSNSVGEEVARSPQEAIQKLSTRHLQAFDVWKSQIIKSCDAAQAFGVRSRQTGEHDGIDGRAVFEANEGSALFSDEQSVALISDYRGLSGESESRVSESVEFNGRSSTMRAVAKRQGSTCVVYAFGQKVYETRIASHFVVGAHWQKQETESEAQQVIETSNLEVGGRTEMRFEKAKAAIREAFIPSLAAINVLQKKLNLKQEEVLKYFRPARSLEATAIVKIADDPRAIWTEMGSQTLVGTSDLIHSLIRTSPGSLAIEVQIKIPEFSFAEGHERSLAGRLKFRVSARFQATSDPRMRSVVLSHPEPLGYFNSDSVEALNCAQEQVEAFEINNRTRERVRPSTAELWVVCGVLHSDVERLADRSDLLRKLLPVALAGVQSGANVHLQGWDRLLNQEAFELYEQGLDVSQALDPRGRSPLITRLGRWLNSLKGELESATNKEKLRGPLYQVAFAQTMTGRGHTDVNLGRSVRALDRIVVDLPGATEQLIGRLARGEPVESEVAYAESLNQNFIEAVRTATALARALSFETEFDRDYLSQVLRRAISTERILSWGESLRKIQRLILRFPALRQLQQPVVSFAMRRGEVIDREARSLEEILSSVAHLADPFLESVKKWLSESEHSSTEEHRLYSFAQSVTPAYKAHAVALRDSAKRLGRETEGLEVFNRIVQNKWSSEEMMRRSRVWVATSNFSEREKARTRNEFGSPNEYALRRFVERALQEGWAEPQFQAFESLALAASAKNTCERLQGLSSLAECANQRLFSTQNKMFFDPNWGERYGKLGTEFQAHFRTLSGREWQIMRWNLVQALFGAFEPLWSQCNNTVFQENSAALRSDVSALARERDTMRKWEIERRIQKRLENCRN